jgi:hypothetical protein
MWFLISVIVMSFMGYRVISGLRRGRIVAFLNFVCDRKTDKFGFWEYVIFYSAFFLGFLWLAIHVVVKGDL